MRPYHGTWARSESVPVKTSPTILLIGPTPPPYHGVSLMMRSLLRWKAGGPFRIIHLELADRRGIQHVDRPDLHDVFLFCGQWIRLISLLLRERPQLVYLPLSQSTVGFLRDSFFLWPAALLRRRILIHLHGSHFRQWYAGLSRPLKSYVQSTLRTVTRAIVLGESLRAVFDGLVPDERISVVPNGVGDGGYEPRETEETERRRFRILHLSTLCRQKGALVILSAIPLVLQKRRDVKFILAGEWARKEDRLAADSLIRREALEKYLLWPGHVTGERKEQLYQSADLFLFPGIQPEGQPLVLLEAMAAGLPVLYTDRGCVSETVMQDENGLQVAANDPADLASKILWCLDHPKQLRAMGVRSRLRYEQHYTDEQFRKRMADVIWQTLADTRQSA